MKELAYATQPGRTLLLTVLLCSFLSSTDAQVGSAPRCEIRSEPLVVRKLEKPIQCRVYFPGKEGTEIDTLSFRVPRVLKVRMPCGSCRDPMFKPANTEMVVRNASGQVVGDAMPFGRLSGYKVHRSTLQSWDETRLSRSPSRTRRSLFSRTWKFPLGSTGRSECLENTIVLKLEPGHYTVTFQCRERFEDPPTIMGSTQLFVSEAE